MLKGATGLASGTASEGHGQTGAMLPALLRRVTVSGGTIRIELSNRALDGTTGPGMIDKIEPGEPATLKCRSSCGGVVSNSPGPARRRCRSAG